MHPVTDPKRDELVRLAEEHLKRHQPKGYRLQVDPDGVMEEDEWTYVVVKPDRNDVKSYDYSSRLAEAEQDMEDAGHPKILPVPDLPD